jgi:cytochrome c-type biogenesis protein CcmH
VNDAEAIRAKISRAKLIGTLVVALAAWLVAAAPSFAHPRARVNLMTVEANVMCVSCHEPLELAQSPQAQAEKDAIKGWIGQGLTLHQIENRLVAQYGVSVLGKPPAGGFNLTVYVLPPVILILGIGFLVYSLPKWRARARQTAPLEAKPELEPQDADRLNQDLARFI